MRSQRSGVLAGNVFKACSNRFCSSVVHGAGLLPVSMICCSATPTTRENRIVPIYSPTQILQVPCLQRGKIVGKLVSGSISRILVGFLGKKYFILFSNFFHTDHNKYTMKWVGWKMSKTVFRTAPIPLKIYKQFRVRRQSLIHLILQKEYPTQVVAAGISTRNWCLTSAAVIFLFVLRRCSRPCWVRLTSSYGSPFLPVMDVLGGPISPDASRQTECSTRSSSVCLHIIGIVLSFHMSTPPQSASSHHVPNCLRTKASSQFSAGLSFFQGNTTRPPDHPHLCPFHLWLQLCSHPIKYIMSFLLSSLYWFAFVSFSCYHSSLNLAKVFNLSSIKKIIQPV